MTTSENKTELLGVGTCCFCGFECNPLSQSCSSCSRSISGAAIGIPVPHHLKRFVYISPLCKICGVYNPKGSSLFCQRCLDKKEK